MKQLKLLFSLLGTFLFVSCGTDKDFIDLRFLHLDYCQFLPVKTNKSKTHMPEIKLEKNLRLKSLFAKYKVIING